MRKTIIQKNRKGFTLIELMIVVVIIGLLAALAIPRFAKAAKKAKIAEAKLILNNIFKCDQLYYEEHGEYYGEALDIGSIGLSVISFDKVMGESRFVYSIVVSSPPTYVAEALVIDEGGDASLQGYELQMDSEGILYIFEPGVNEVRGKGRKNKTKGRKLGHYK